MCSPDTLDKGMVHIPGGAEWWGLSQPTVVLRTEHNLKLKNCLCLEMFS